LSLLKPVRLPALTLPENLLLAPLAGWTDAAFRSVCVQAGAALGYTEMVSAEGLARGGSKTWELLERADNERYWGVQLFGSDPRSAAAAVRLLAAREPSLIDLNCGCAVPKVLKAGGGAALLRVPQRIGELVRAMRQESGAPVTVKIRSGWDSSSLNYVEAAELACEAGAAAICLHPRTRAQGFSGRAEWAQIAELKRQLPVPVFGSGDVLTAEDALRLAAQTGCDAVLFARGALGNPFIFTQARRLFAGLPPAPAPSAPERLQMALRQLQLAVAFRGERRACRELRKHFAAYSRGLPGGSQLRARAVRAERAEDYERLVREYLASEGWG